MSTEIKVEMKPISTIVNRLGISADGDVQRFVTENVCKRITKYMPFRSGALATKLKVVKSQTEIEVLGPYARYQYYGKVMVGAAPKTLTDRDLRYDATKNTRAGPFWDRALMAAESSQIAADTQRYIDRKAGSK